MSQTAQYQAYLQDIYRQYVGFQNSYQNQSAIYAQLQERAAQLEPHYVQVKEKHKLREENLKIRDYLKGIKKSFSDVIEKAKEKDDIKQFAHIDSIDKVERDLNIAGGLLVKMDQEAQALRDQREMKLAECRETMNRNIALRNELEPISDQTINDTTRLRKGNRKVLGDLTKLNVNIMSKKLEYNSRTLMKIAETSNVITNTNISKAELLVLQSKAQSINFMKALLSEHPPSQDQIVSQIQYIQQLLPLPERLDEIFGNCNVLIEAFVKDRNSITQCIKQYTESFETLFPITNDCRSMIDSLKVRIAKISFDRNIWKKRLQQLVAKADIMTNQNIADKEEENRLRNSIATIEADMKEKMQYNKIDASVIKQIKEYNDKLTKEIKTKSDELVEHKRERNNVSQKLFSNLEEFAAHHGSSTEFKGIVEDLRNLISQSEVDSQRFDYNKVHSDCLDDQIGFMKELREKKVLVENPELARVISKTLSLSNQNGILVVEKGESFELTDVLFHRFNFDQYYPLSLMLFILSRDSPVDVGLHIGSLKKFVVEAIKGNKIPYYAQRQKDFTAGGFPIPGYPNSNYIDIRNTFVEYLFNWVQYAPERISIIPASLIDDFISFLEQNASSHNLSQTIQQKLKEANSFDKGQRRIFLTNVYPKYKGKNEVDQIYNGFTQIHFQFYINIFAVDFLNFNKFDPNNYIQKMIKEQTRTMWYFICDVVSEKLSNRGSKFEIWINAGLLALKNKNFFLASTISKAFDIDIFRTIFDQLKSKNKNKLETDLKSLRELATEDKMKEAISSVTGFCIPDIMIGVKDLKRLPQGNNQDFIQYRIISSVLKNMLIGQDSRPNLEVIDEKLFAEFSKQPKHDKEEELRQYLPK